MRAPRGSFEGLVGGGALKKDPLSFDRWPPRLPQGASEAAKRAPREPQERPKRAPRQPQEGPRGFQNVPKRALRWPQEAYKTLPKREIVKNLILIHVVVVIVTVVVFALFFLVVVPSVLPCSSREHRPITPDDQCTSQRRLFWDGLVEIREA